MTPRQQKLLHAVIDEFIETAHAVGSVNLADKSHRGISPATIRNEMADLVELGFLMKPHSSSGRIPTNTGFKHIIDKLFDERDDYEVPQGSQIYEELFQHRFDRPILIKNTLKVLAKKTNLVAFITTNKVIHFSGLANILKHPEFKKPSRLKRFLDLSEDYELLLKVFSNYQVSRPVQVLIGKETGLDKSDKIAVIFSKIQLYGDEEGYLSLIGPNRMNYSRIIPLFEFVSNSLSDVLSGW